jgi:hypothetical protein
MGIRMLIFIGQNGQSMYDPPQEENTIPRDFCFCAVYDMDFHKLPLELSAIGRIL